MATPKDKSVQSSSADEPENAAESSADELQADAMTTERVTTRVESFAVPSGPPTPQQIVIDDSRGAVSRLAMIVIASLGWFAFVVSLFYCFYLWAGRNEYYETSGGIKERYHSGDKYGSKKIAIINISGVIYSGDGYVKKQIDRAAEDTSVKAVVVRVNSPGGTVAGSDYIFHHLKELKASKERGGDKFPMVISMGSIAASGGYYASMAIGDEEDVIFAEPTTSTGSIGVIIPHYDLTGLMERFDVRDDSIVSHPHKQMLSMTRKIDEDEQEILQAYVDELFEMFKDRVKEGRPYFADNEDALTELATGEVFTARRAKELKLVDKIGFIEDAIKRAANLAGLDQKKVRVVRYRLPDKLLEISLSDFVQTPHRSELETLFELSTPRAYYIATSLPSLIRSQRAN